MKQWTVIVMLLVTASSASQGRKPPPTTSLAPRPTMRPFIGQLAEASKRRLPSEVRIAALGHQGRSLLISDGNTCGPTGADLTVLSSVDFSAKLRITMSAEMTGGYPWAASGMAMHPSGRRILVYNQLLDLETGAPLRALRLQKVIDMPNVFPEPLSISPDGDLALVVVGSYWSQDLSALAVFDLKSRSPPRSLLKGNGTPAFFQTGRRAPGKSRGP